MKKKILGLLLVVFLSVVAIGCNFSGGTITIDPGNGNGTTTVDLDDVFLNVESQIKNKNAITDDITLPTTFGSVTISWVSDNPDLIDNQGRVHRPDVDTNVILKCTITSGQESKKYEVHVTIKAKEQVVVVDAVAKLDSAKQGTYYGDDVVVVVMESTVKITDPSGKTLEYTIYQEGTRYYVVDNGNKMYCTFGDGTVTNDKGTFTKRAETLAVSSIQTILSSNVGDKYKAKATVVAISNVSVLLKDNTGFILVYFGTSYAKDLAVGDEIEIEGVTSTYKGSVQFSGGTYTKVGTKTVSYPAAEELSGAAVDALTTVAPAVKYVKVQGKLVLSGSYVNLEVEGATNKVSVVSPVQSVSELDGKKVEITGYYLYVNGSSPLYVNIIITDIKDLGGTDVPPVVLNESTISEVKAGTVGEKYKTKGIVVAVSNVSALLKDSTDYILAYFGTNFAKDLVVGDEVIFEGITSAYKDTIQFNGGSYTKVGTGEVTHPQSEVLDGSAIDTLLKATPVTKLVKVQGKLVISGNYVNLEVAGTSAKGSIVSPIQNVSDFDGKNVVVTGYYLYVNGSNPQYVNIILVDIEEAGGTTPSTETVAKLTADQQGTYYGSGVTVVVEESKVTITEPTGKTFSFVLYVDSDNKIYINEEGNRVYCTFGDGTITNSKGTFTKNPTTIEFVTLDQAKAGTVGGTYNVKATVVAVSAVSFLLKDATDYMLVYLGTSFTKDLQVGNEVELTGKTGTYKDTVQFTTASYKVTGNNEVAYPEPEVLTSESMDALTVLAPETKYVKVAGKLSISGSYINLAVEGTSVVGSVVNPIQGLSNYSDKNVVITGYFLYVTGSTTKYVNIILTNIEEGEGNDTPVELPISSISDVKAGNVGEKYKVKAIVVAVSGVSALLKDDTDYILVYFGSSFAKDLKVGNEILLEGVTSSYKDTVQFGGGNYTVVGEYTFTYPEAVELNGKEMDILASATPVVTYVKLAGNLTISGNYINLKVELSENLGSIVTPLIDLSDYAGKDVVVTGYYLYVTGSSPKYFNIIMTDIALKDGTSTNPDEAAVDEIIDEFNNLDFPAVYNSLILPTGGDGIGITWISSNPDVLESNGTYHMPSAPVDVKFTVIVKKGDVEKTTEVTFRVVGLETIASVLATTDFDNYHAVKGIAVAIGREGFVLQDSTGLISTSNGAFAQDVEVGDEVLVIGPVSTFGSLPQFSQYNLHYEKTGNKATVSYPEPVVLDASSFETLFDSTESKYVQVTGSLEAGEYLSILTVEGTEVAGGLLHANLLEYDGMDVTIKGYFMYSVEGYKKFNEIFVTEITVDGTANVEMNKVEKVARDIVASLDGETIYVPYAYYSDDDDVSIEWSSSNSDIYEMGSIPLYQASATRVTLTAVVSCGEASKEVQVTVIVAPLTPLAEVNSDDAEQWFVVKGQVVAETRDSVLLKDESGTVVIYFGSNSKSENLFIGAEIYYFGKVVSYAGINEFNYGYFVLLDSSDVIYPEPAILDGAGVDALVDTTEAHYVKVTGDLELSGNYANLYTKGGEYVVSLVSPIEDLTEVNGERIVVTGYYVYTAGSSTKYPSIMMTGYELYEWPDEELVNELKASLDSLVEVPCFAGITMAFPEGVEVTISSDHEDIISNDLEYNFPSEDTLVTLTVTITKGEATVTATSSFVCKAPQSISTVLAYEDLSERFLVKGVVVAVSTQSFLVQDETGLILAYYGANFEQDLEIGDVVYLRGYITEYYGTRQFGKNVGYTKTGETEEVNYPDPVVLDASGFDALFETTTLTYVELTATLNVSGNYYNLVVEGSENKGSITYPADENLALANGTEVTLKGYYVYTNGTSKKYISFLATELTYTVSE